MDKGEWYRLSEHRLASRSGKLCTTGTLSRCEAGSAGEEESLMLQLQSVATTANEGFPGHKVSQWACMLGSQVPSLTGFHGVGGGDPRCRDRSGEVGDSGESGESLATELSDERRGHSTCHLFLVAA